MDGKPGLYLDTTIIDVIAALLDVAEYLEPRIDADDGGPNREIQLLDSVEAALASLGRLQELLRPPVTPGPKITHQRRSA